jgi:hypothetical protein
MFDRRLIRIDTEVNENRLGFGAVHESTTTQTMEEPQNILPKKEKEAAAVSDDEFEALMRHSQAKQQLQAAVQKQVEGWVHEKIPALGGRTPIEAIRDPDGKEMVEALLVNRERLKKKEHFPDQLRPDTSALRRLLNLAPTAS